MAEIKQMLLTGEKLCNGEFSSRCYSKAVLKSLYMAQLDVCAVCAHIVHGWRRVLDVCLELAWALLFRHWYIQKGAWGVRRKGAATSWFLCHLRRSSLHCRSSAASGMSHDEEGPPSNGEKQHFCFRPRLKLGFQLCLCSAAAAGGRAAETTQRLGTDGALYRQLARNCQLLSCQSPPITSTLRQTTSSLSLVFSQFVFCECQQTF